MLTQHRARIDLCRETLLRSLDITRLWPKLFEHNIFNADDVNIPRWQRNVRDISTIDEILTTIKTRGPHAFDNLLKSLREIDQAHLAAILEGSTANTAANNNTNNVHNTSNNLPQNILECVPSDNPQNNTVEYSNDEDNWPDDSVLVGKEPVVIKVRKSTQFLDEGDSHIISRYPMRSKPRGLVLLITLMSYVKSNRVRIAAQHDHNNLVELFQQMGFEVVPLWDLSASAIRREVFVFSQKPELRKVDSCFVIITGHGDRSADRRTVVSGTDTTGDNHPDHEISCLEIIQYFSAEACPNLSRKPKIFIFQTCRGGSRQYAVMDRGGSGPSCNDDIYITNEDAPRDSGTRNFADVLIAHSTLPGYVSFRDKLCGTWFIQILCNVFMRMAWALPIRDLFNKIDEVIATRRTYRNECQTPTIKSMGFNKHLYINPGLFTEES